MYKLLPILLFAFLIAEENSESQIIQPDSLDFIWAQDKIDEWKDIFIGDILNIFDKDKLVINIENNIIDVVIVEGMDSDSFEKATSEFILESDNNYIFMHMPDSIDSHPLSYISYTMFVHVFFFL